MCFSLVSIETGGNQAYIKRALILVVARFSDLNDCQLPDYQYSIGLAFLQVSS